MLIRPHKVQVGIQNNLGTPAHGSISFAWFRSFAEGGMTYRSALADQRLITKWAMDVPRVTILHMGACFIAGSMDLDVWYDEKGNLKSMKEIYRREVDNFLKSWMELTEAACTSPASLELYKKRVQVHRFVLVNVPDWCNQSIRGMTPATYREHRINANAGVGKMEGYLWKTYSVIQCRPRMNNVKFKGNSVHPDVDSQLEWAEQVLRFASFVCCSHCHWTKGEYVKEEHDRVHSASC